MTQYSWESNPTHGWAIFVEGSEADPNIPENKFRHYADPDDEGGIVGTSEWIWLEDDNARRIVVALNFFANTPTETIERMIQASENATVIRKIRLIEVVSE